MSRPWSYTRYGAYQDCPQKYNFKYVEKIPSTRPEGKASNRGSEIHLQAELYLRGELMIYPPEIQKVAGHAMALRAKGAMPELKYAVKDDWSPCDWADPDTYFRGILDVTYVEGHVLHIQDWKTGQIYPEHAKQMEVYAALAAPQYPEAELYMTRLIYIDQGVVTPPKTVTKEKLKPIRILLDAGIKNAETAESFPATPSPGACRWCDYSKKFGGPCTKG